jgi:HK97 family phage prohead protease
LRNRANAESEQFAPGAFSRSIAAGGQVVKLDLRAEIPGRLTLFEGPDLRFRFHVSDTPIGRRVFGLAQRGELHGVSIGFERMPERERYGYGGVRLVDEGRLLEISLCEQGRPAWYGTVVQIEA